MTRIKFYFDGKTLCGFSVSGHSTDNCDDMEGKLVCAAVSSAVYMTANTITDVIGIPCELAVADGDFSLRLQQPSEQAVTVLKGFQLHVDELSRQYPKRIKIFTEV